MPGSFRDGKVVMVYLHVVPNFFCFNPKRSNRKWVGKVAMQNFIVQCMYAFSFKMDGNKVHVAMKIHGKMTVYIIPVTYVISTRKCVVHQMAGWSFLLVSSLTCFHTFNGCSSTCNEL